MVMEVRQRRELMYGFGYGLFWFGFGDCESEGEQLKMGLP